MTPADRIRAYRACFTSAAGKKVLADLIPLYDRVTHVPGDSHETAFREGQRAVVGSILAKLKQASDARILAALDEQAEEIDG